MRKWIFWRCIGPLRFALGGRKSFKTGAGSGVAQQGPASWLVDWRRGSVRFAVVSGFCALNLVLAPAATGQVAEMLRDRAQAEVERIKAMVADGTLPEAALEQAKQRLADAQDQETLAETLYSPSTLQNMTQEQADAMVAAASRRMDREQSLLEERQKFLDMGIISQSELLTVKTELDNRRTVLELATDRVRLMNELHEMAAEEKRMEMPTLANSMIRFSGSKSFSLDQLPSIRKDFKNQFHHELPVSAIGETAVHQSLGLDHRNKVDVALNPEQPEGLWLRRYLEKLQIPYMAFKNAVAGAATGAHIHIGTESVRLSLLRPN